MDRGEKFKKFLLGHRRLGSFLLHTLERWDMGNLSTSSKAELNIWMSEIERRGTDRFAEAFEHANEAVELLDAGHGKMVYQESWLRALLQRGKVLKTIGYHIAKETGDDKKGAMFSWALNDFQKAWISMRKTPLDSQARNDIDPSLELEIALEYATTLALIGDEQQVKDARELIGDFYDIAVNKQDVNPWLVQRAAKARGGAGYWDRPHYLEANFGEVSSDTVDADALLNLSHVITNSLRPWDEELQIPGHVHRS